MVRPDLVRRAEEYAGRKGLNLTTIDIGGGFPIRHVADEHVTVQNYGAKMRRDLVLDRMAEYEMISPRDRDQAKSLPVEVKPTSILNYSDAPYFVDYVQDILTEKFVLQNRASFLPNLSFLSFPLVPPSFLFLFF